MKLSDAIRIWDEIHTNDCGQMGFNDLERAIALVVGVENDCISMDTLMEVSSQPSRLLSGAAPSNIGFQRTGQADGPSGRITIMPYEEFVARYCTIEDT